MRFNKWIGFVLVAFIAASAVVASARPVVVQVRPPNAIVENRGMPPGPQYAWVNGYHRWDGGRFEWVPAGGKFRRGRTPAGPHISG